MSKGAGRDGFANDAAGFKDGMCRQGKSIVFHQDGGDVIIFLQVRYGSYCGVQDARKGAAVWIC